MFDIGFSELVLIGVIALIVIGPERLPEVARTAGKYIGRMRRFVNKVRDDIESEINQEELREELKRHADLDDIKKIISDSRYTIENEVEETRQHVVKARDDDPRGDFSQKDLLEEQGEEFENEDYGLTDHHDHAADEAVTETAETQTETAATTPSKTKSKARRTRTKASGADNNEQDSAETQTETAATTPSKTKTKARRTQAKASATDNNEQDDGHNEKSEI
ncbi:MAG: Sec-independent protein translocase protein TatB [Gammaproteobacteria bacterium]|jgi:sec-independent protein translocase protein TatB